MMARIGMLLGSGAALAVGAGFAAHVRWRASGPRGSDQYWYLADIVMRRETGRSVSNHVFPRHLPPMGTATNAAPPPPVHNVPVTHLVSAAHRSRGRSDRSPCGEYRSWVRVNTGLALCGAAVVGVAIGRPWGWRGAVLGSATVLAFPLSTWLSLNALSEAALLPLGGLLAAAAATIDRAAPGASELAGPRVAGSEDARASAAAGVVSLAAVSGLMYLQRDNHAPQLAGAVVGAWALRAGGRMGTVSAVTTTAVAAASVCARAMLPTMAGIPPSELLMVAIGDTTVLEHRLEWSGEVLRRKVTHGLRSALAPPATQQRVLLALPLYVTASCGAALLRRPGQRWLGATAVLVSLQHCATAALFGVQDRYAATLVPIGAVAAGHALAPLRARPGARRLIGAGAAALTAMFAARSAVAGRAYSSLAQAEAPAVESIRCAAAGLPTGAVLAFRHGSVQLQLPPYALAPRFVIDVVPPWQDADFIARQSADWNAVAALTWGNDDERLLASALAAEHRLIRVADVSVGDVSGVLWRLERAH